jgi:hypothetical protein
MEIAATQPMGVRTVKSASRVASVNRARMLVMAGLGEPAETLATLMLLFPTVISIDTATSPTAAVEARVALAGLAGTVAPEATAAAEATALLADVRLAMAEPPVLEPTVAMAGTVETGQLAETEATEEQLLYPFLGIVRAYPARPILEGLEAEEVTLDRTGLLEPLAWRGLREQAQPLVVISALQEPVPLPVIRARAVSLATLDRLEPTAPPDRHQISL